VKRGIAVALAAALAGCNSAPKNAVTTCEETTLVPTKTDILFVVDDSGSMSEEQANLSANLKAFIDRLAQAPVKPDYQIGVTTTSVEGFNGETSYAAGPSRDVPYPRGALVSVDAAGRIAYDAASNAFTGTRILRADSPRLAQDFEANVLVGVNGSGKEMALDAVRRALSDRITDGANAGFLRAGARLAIVILSDEDDCTQPAGQPRATQTQCRDEAFKVASLEPVQDFVDFLRGPIAGETRDVAVTAIIAVDPVTRARGTTCLTAPDAAVRHWDFARAFGQQSLVDSICNASFRDSLDGIAGLIAQNVTLSQEPADVRVLQVTVERRDGTSTACQVEPAGPDAATADAIYSPPQAGRAPALQFQGRCLLQQGDQVRLQILCAG
jgi:hypothetical protein